jgi:SAM-dependent methyltransferase
MNDEERPTLVQRVELIKNMCKGRSVLHLGCTNYPYTSESLKTNSLLHLELKEVCGDLYGFDFDQEGIRVLAEAGVENLYRADLEALQDVDLDRTFDIIIAGEMIEHLPNPGLFLRGIQRFMHEGTSLVITTINAYCAMRFAIYALRGKGGPAEPVHPDHVAYYSYRTLKLLIEKEGLKVDKFFFYDIGREHRPFNRKIYNLINDVCVMFSPHLSDGVIAVCGLAKKSE